MKKFKKIRTKKSNKYGHWYRVDVDEVIMPSGKKGEYNVVRVSMFSTIIPIDKEGNVYFIKQHRYTIDQISIELPTGHGDGQKPLDAAKRELFEETGITSTDWTELGVIYEANGIGEIPGAVFVAKNVKKTSEPKEMDDEYIVDVLKMSVEEVKRMIKENKITDSVTISAFAKADYSGMLN